MAETNSSLGFTSKLQIVIVPSGKTYATPADKTGKLIFREGTNIIEVNGHEYKATSSADLTAITTALKNTGYLTAGSNGALTANNPGTVAALLGTKIATSGDGKKTVSAWIDDILGQISGINTDISNLEKATATDGTGNFVVRDKSGEGKTDFANTTAIQTAINKAREDAKSAAAKDATTKVNAAKEALIGTGKDSTESSSTPLKPGTGNTWAQSEAQQKNLSHLKDLLVNLQSQLDTLTGTNLENVNKAIQAIEKELKDGEGSGLTTIIDGLKVFLGSGLNSSGATHTVGGTSSTYTLQEIITALENQIKAVQGKHSVVTDGVTGDAEAGSTNYAVVTSSTTDGKTTYTVKTTKALETALSNAKTTITTVGGTASNTANYITVTKSPGTGSKADNYTIKSTTALDTALSNAKTAVTGGTGTASSTNYIAVTKTTNGHDSYAVSTTTALDSAISSAQTNAEATALSYANSVITWTVIS